MLSIAKEQSAPAEDSVFIVVLDRTIFHPQGGGQPSDVGTIRGAAAEFRVVNVAANKETGVIEHRGSFTVRQ